MKKMHIIATSDRRILAVAQTSDIPNLLSGAIIEKEWFYNNPKELEDFLKENPNELEYFLKGFSYWIESKVKGYIQKNNHYGKLKRLIKEFSKNLFKKIRSLTTRIAKQIKMIIKPKKAIYEERRKEKRIYQKITSRPIKFKNL